MPRSVLAVADRSHDLTESARDLIPYATQTSSGTEIPAAHAGYGPHVTIEAPRGSAPPNGRRVELASTARSIAARSSVPEDPRLDLAWRELGGDPLRR